MEILIFILLTVFFSLFLLHHQRTREREKPLVKWWQAVRWKHAGNTQFISLFDGRVSVNRFLASQFKTEVFCMAIFISYFQLPDIIEVSLGKPKYSPSTMLNSKQHKVQISAHSDAVADIGSSIFCFKFMYLLTQPMLECDPVFPLLNQRTWAVISISQRRQGGWYPVIPCQNCHPSA